MPSLSLSLSFPSHPLPLSQTYLVHEPNDGRPGLLQPRRHHTALLEHGVARAQVERKAPGVGHFLMPDDDDDDERELSLSLCCLSRCLFKPREEKASAQEEKRTTLLVRPWRERRRVEEEAEKRGQETGDARCLLCFFFFFLKASLLNSLVKNRLQKIGEAPLLRLLPRLLTQSSTRTLRAPAVTFSRSLICAPPCSRRPRRREWRRCRLLLPPLLLLLLRRCRRRRHRRRRRRRTPLGCAPFAPRKQRYAFCFSLLKSSSACV